MLVVDACVASSLFLAEHNSKRAEEVFLRDVALLAPHFFVVEVTQVLWTSVRRGRTTREVATRGWHSLLDLPVDYVPDAQLLSEARDIASLHDIAVYDSLYVALAAERGVPLVTADDALCAKLRRARISGLRFELI